MFDVRAAVSRSATDPRTLRVSGRRLCIERLEERTLLAVAANPLAAKKFYQEAIRPDDRRLADHGDYYVSDGEPIGLLRMRTEDLIGFESKEARDAALITLAQLKTGWVIFYSLGDRYLVANRPYGPLEAATDPAGLAGYAWTAEVFVGAQYPRRLFIADEVIVNLRPDVDPAEVLAPVFTSYQRFVGTQFIGRLAAGGVENLETAHQLAADARVEWAAPNIWGAVIFNTNDSLYNEQWYLENVHQFGAKDDADADLPEAWGTGYVGDRCLALLRPATDRHILREYTAVARSLPCRRAA